ncbi:grasp-with-spasm system ATP-grasp peptide maturase [Flavobacterium tegetincola]|uniref:grasp-with-spasm system ATP-grasp peptide maturase n=1 Tax=Flavobacterium tegetincola TaxID=150172 RepID=UPI00041D247F|nr:grasp-with-spasm system ATP-grasp peptide maturase [Flavobacterium tegetincola]
MILIITEKADQSTNNVINWLSHFKLKWFRINEDDDLDYLFSGTDITIKKGKQSFDLSEIKAVWYRRGHLRFKFHPINDEYINNSLKSEYIKIHEFIYYKLSLLPHINTFKGSDVNKLIVSDIARKLNIKTPDDYLFSEKIRLSILEPHLEYSTKSITGSNVLHYEGFFAVDYTVKLEGNYYIPTTFFPSLIQNYIVKKYELRIFYLQGEFWSMAIFSQKDNTTATDFRNYNRQKPNRNVSFDIPKYLKIQLRELMTELNLNCGSIDMIVTPENEFYFLEVNPIGQFGMVDIPCNYGLNKEIASYFKKYYYD